MGDNLNNLPVDDMPLSKPHQQIVDNLFKKDGYDFSNICMGLKTTVLTGGLFLVFSMPYIDSFVRKVMPFTTKSNLYLVFMKTVIFMILYFIITNYHLAFKNS